ncbi:hypothetical protein HYDPIDRAFT_131516 [Hydnomerulius pinastri MD-312]|uniref:Uncharacterized protein n=1 Tax=Hydnomerulius pinastri MD-312 TaxID=994086 RepID=A0A0C9VHR1_9AGAM|nr:hypothetical protein HYDPIDRAFT_131516 [Hydnomerulius pinastri MD-312]
MCFKFIQCAEHSCNHPSVTKQQIVDCNKRNCRFSGLHNGHTHQCTATCAQRLLPDQSIIMDTLSYPCSRCRGGMNSHAN